MKASLRNLVFLGITSGLVAGLGSVGQAAFDTESIGARPTGMGSAYCAVAADGDALVYNPAGLGQLQIASLGLNYVRLLTGLNDGNLSDSRVVYVQPLAGFGTLGLGWLQRNLQGLYQENTLLLGAGVPVNADKTLLLGSTLKVLQVAYLDETAVSANEFFADRHQLTNFTLDAGGFYQLDHQWTAGLSLQNLTQPNMALGSASSVVPLQLRLGAAWHPDPYLGTCELLWQGTDYRIGLGSEAWWFSSLLGTRLGAGVGNSGKMELTAGLTFRVVQPAWGIQLDYAFVNPLGEFGDFGSSHLLNLTFKFGVEKREDKVALAHVYIESGEQFRKQGESEKALEAWEEAAELVPEDKSVAQKIIQVRKEIDLQAEIKLYLQQGQAFEKSGNYLNASAEYRRASILDPNNVQIQTLLNNMEEKIRQFTQRQKKVQAQKEEQASMQAKQQSSQQARIKLQQAAAELGASRKNPDLNRRFAKNLLQLQEQLNAAENGMSEGETAQAVVAAQTVIRELEILKRRQQTQERILARKHAESSAGESTVPAAAPTKTEVPVADVVYPVVAGAAELEKLRKRARGAYGRVVKLMLDIDAAKGDRYYPQELATLKNEMAQMKTLLSKEDYAACIQYGGTLFPKLERLKKLCLEKENVRNAVPTNW